MPAEPAVPLSGPSPSPFVVVGLGASAGGIEALEAFFSGLPRADGAAFVVVLHLDPDRESEVAELLGRAVPLPVTQVTETVEVEPGHVYVIPPDHNLDMDAGRLRLTPLEDERARRRPIDHFFRTLADAYGERAIAIVLSGTGHNGTVGVRRVKEAGGLVLAQAPEDAVYDEMPRSALASGVVDRALPAAELGAVAITYAEHLHRVRLPEDHPETLPHDDVRDVQRILAQLRTRTGHDFAHYKRATVLRRLARRLHISGVDSLGAYLDVLRQSPAEARDLLADLLISVTNFFRDSDAFEALAADVIPGLFAGKAPEDEVRVWVAGCATGEEAYSVAMLLAEHAAGLAEPPAIQVFATDLSEAAVRTARAGIYPESIEADVSPERLRRYFRKVSGGYRVSDALREQILFAPHSLLRDPPFAHLDLVTCRNLLIYLQRGLQRRVLELFHYALDPGGALFLGTSETADAASDLFGTESKKARIYRRRDTEAVLPPVSLSPRRRTMDPLGPAAPDSEADLPEPVGFATLHQRLRAAAAAPSVLVTEGYEVLHLSDDAAGFLRLAGGEPTRNVLRLLLPELRPAAQAALFQARRQAGPAESGPAGVTLDGQPLRVLLRAEAVGEAGVLRLAFEATPAAPAAPVPTGDAHLQALAEEVQETREQLQLTIEEFETSREELRAQNEELQSINEELRSTAEELETSKEEAQSMAEELQTVNDEMKEKVEELAQAKGDLENLIASTEIATLFLDRRLQIQWFTPRVRDLFHVRSSDVGRPLADLTQKFGGGHLIEDAEAVVERLETQEREVEGADGRWYLVHVRPYRTVDDRIGGVVVTFVDISERRRNEQVLLESEERYRLLVEGTTEYAFLTFALDGRVTSWSAGAERIFGHPEAEVLGESGALIFTEEDRATGVFEHEMATAAEAGRASDERWHLRTDGTRFWASGTMTALRDPDGELRGFAKVLRDNTHRKEAEETLRESMARFREMAETVPDVLFTATAGGEVDYVSGQVEELLGIAPAALLGTRTWAAMVHPEDLERAAAAWGEAIAGRSPFETRCRFQRADGGFFWAIARARPVVDADGRLTRWFGTITDVDALVEAERALQVLNETLETRVGERTAQVCDLAAQLTVAEQTERRRIAHVLHDDLQQQLYGLSLFLTLLKVPSSEDARRQLQRSEAVLSEAMALTRTLSAELAPSVLDSEDIGDLLRWVVDKMGATYDLEVELDMRGPCRVEEPAARVLLYRALREILFNVVKHAHTDRARLVAEATNGEVVVQVEDGGAGFDLAELNGSASGGFGLPSVRDRLFLVGGRCEIESVPGAGTRVSLAVPAGRIETGETAGDGGELHRKT